MNVYKYTDYRLLLAELIEHKSKAEARSGVKKDLAEYVRCSPSLVSKALHGEHNFSPEAGLRLCRYFDLNEEESDHFLLLLSYESAGSEDLRQFIKAKVTQNAKKKVSNFQSVLKMDGILSVDQQKLLYSSWRNLAVALCSQLEGIETREEIAKRLNISLKSVNECIGLLERLGCMTTDDGFKINLGNVMQKSSLATVMNATNWRIKALETLQHSIEDADKVYLTTLQSLSNEDYLRFKAMITDFAQDTYKLVRESERKDVLTCLNIDFFQVR